MKAFRYLLLSSILLSAITWSAQAQARIGTIDLRTVFDKYHKTITADAALKEEANELDQEKKKMVDAFRKDEEEWRALLDRSNDQALSAEERERSKRTAEQRLIGLREREQTIAGFERSARAQLAEKQRRKRDAILQEIRDVINARAKAAGYTLVIDTAAEGLANTPVVLFSTGENDLTDVVLSQLNAGTSGSAARPEEPRRQETPRRR
jgi:outer membrane protein